MKIFVDSDGIYKSLFEVEKKSGHIELSSTHNRYNIALDQKGIKINNNKYQFGFKETSGGYLIHINGESFDVKIEDGLSYELKKLRTKPKKKKSTIDIVAPIPGMIVKILVKTGQKVSVGQPMLIINAMKMENEIASHVSGRVKEILTSEGKLVNKNDLLISLV